MSGTAADASRQPGAAETVDAVLAAVDADFPRIRLLLGSQAFDIVLPTYERRVQTWRDWEQTTRSADAS